MDEAEHEGGTEVSAALEGAVLTILREIGEDPGREVSAPLKAAFPMYAAADLRGIHVLVSCLHIGGNSRNTSSVA